MSLEDLDIPESKEVLKKQNHLAMGWQSQRGRDANRKSFQ